MLLKLLSLMLAMVFSLVFVICVSILGNILFLRWKYRHLPCPKMKSFLLGHAVEVGELTKKGGHVSMLVDKWRRIYGSVYVLFFINQVTVMCLEPSVVKELLINSSSSKPRNFYGVFHSVFGKRLAGNGLFSELNNDNWAKKRKMFNPAFKRGYLVKLMDQYNDSVSELVIHLRPKADGKSEILMADQLNKVALDIIGKVAFGLNNLNVISDDEAPFCRAVTQIFTGAMAQLRLSFIGTIDPRESVRTLRKKTTEAIDLLRKTGNLCIADRIKAINEGREYPPDILTYILQASNNLQASSEFGMQEMIDEFVTFFVAGQETTAQLMSFFYELVGRNPDVYNKVQEEVDFVIGNKPTITYEDISKLDYMNLVLKEVLRYTPPAVGVQRVAPQDLVINGYKIPAGTAIMLNHYALGRDERFWDEPEKFDPERFRDEDKRRNCAYFPFSLGPRVCIGQQFAMIEAKVIIAKLVQCFDFKLVPGVKLLFIPEVTLKSKNRTPLYLTLRKI
ncbi:Cholesterol 24-hydroxylase [Holothuria leucospilota]|uniref:Cholesterol 24-hydroxylase n=1 Tax=Holothuria leucospilota TaxID=206669 RepID=A0A9Q1CK79_HOLLE|nr:Cholesterol 24-hydroxylase [Holothuria leucospilota]